MSGIRHDKLTQKTRKAHRCDWCRQPIGEQTQMIRVSGIGDDGAFHAKFHPECWRAEYFYFHRQLAIDDLWPEERMARGRTDDDFAAGPEFTDRPLEPDEVKHRYKYRDSWLLASAGQSSPSKS